VCWGWRVTVARGVLVDVGVTPYYHYISRCVRRAFLCGEDPLSGRNFDHRKLWLVERVKVLSRIFAIDICAYAAMSNHFHLVLRIDRERASGFDEADVVERYGRLFPEMRRLYDRIDEDARAPLVARWRERLWSVSWFMRCLNEDIARRANQEDGCSGRFWEGRFRSQALLDPGALLTCMTYVDLNPIRAGIASCLEEAEYTSIQERLFLFAKATQAEGAEPARNATARRMEEGQLVPFLDQGRLETDGESSRLPIRFKEYVNLLRETSGALTGDAVEVTALSPRARASLRRQGLNGDGFAANLREFGRSFFTMVGERQLIEEECRRRGYRRCLALTASMRLYANAA